MIRPKEIFAFSVTLLFLYALIEAKEVAFAQTSASQIERIQEMTEKEELLRNKLEKEEKFLVKKIVVQGVTLLSKDEIKKIALPFQNHWLSKNDIEEIITRIKKAYKEKGYNNQPADTSFRVKGNLLEIRITEGK